MDPPHVTTALVAATTPVVLRIKPLLGSQAPIGYIYDPTPARDGNGGLLAAASAFFAHQGHQDFLDPCPDLAAYRRAGGFAEPIIDVDRLPDHVLSAGLNLLESSTPLACPSWRRTFLRLHPLFPTVWSPFLLWGVIPQDSPSLRSAAPVLGGLRLGGALARFAMPLRPHGRSPTRLIPLHHWGKLIPALTLTLASRYSLGLRCTDLAVFLPSTPLAEFPLWLAMGGIPAVKTLGQLFRLRLRTDLLLISEGA